MLERKQDINYLIEKLLELYELLENYIWKHQEKNLNIIIQCQEDKLKIKLLKDKTLLLDYLEIKFNQKERKVYEYITLTYLFNLFKNVMVFNENNKIYNNTHKPYLEFIIEDNKLLNECREIIKMINNFETEKIYQLLEKKYLETNKRDRNIENSTKECLDQRIILTKRLLRSDMYE